MPTLNDSLISNLDLPDSMQIVAPQTPPNSEVSQPSVYNSFTRCPLPPIYQSNPDSIRQFYVSGRIPQNRIYAPSVVKQ